MPALLHAEAVRLIIPLTISLRLEAGELVCVSGPSGIGKTRLLRALADLDPHQGEIRFQGKSQHDFPPSRWRRIAGYLPAESVWWSEQVGEHFDSPEPESLATLALPAEILDWPIERLSAGEKQRLALLRLLANRPDILLLDEPTANLDVENTQRMERLLQSYLQEGQRAILWISHNPQQIQRLADRHLNLTANGLTPAGPDA